MAMLSAPNLDRFQLRLLCEKQVPVAALAADSAAATAATASAN
jgi:mevalonate pyrophosphate decarboxylase